MRSSIQSVKTSGDWLRILCNEAAECAAGRTDPGRVKALCQLTDAVVKIARLQLEANSDDSRARGIQLLTNVPDDTELDRATARMEEISEAIRIVEKAVDDPKTDEAKLPALRGKLNNLRQEQLNLRRILDKRQ